ncbi:MAG: hypothetical protein ACOYL3_14040 [Desulfuromonadaceae bacterium]
MAETAPGALHLFVQRLQRPLQRLGLLVRRAALAISPGLIPLQLFMLTDDPVQLFQPFVQGGEKGIEGLAQQVLGGVFLAYSPFRFTEG